MTEQEFNDIVTQQSPRLMKIAMSYLKNEEEAADAVQETLVNLWLFRSRIDKERDLSALLSTIIKNVCRMYLRKEKRIMEQLTVSVAETGNPHQDMEARERAEAVRKAMSRLSTPHQNVLQMHYAANLSIQQIANIRNTTTSAVKQMLLRARQALRSEIERRNP